MFLFIVGILLALVGIVVALFLKEIRAFGVIALVVALVLIGISCFSSIPTGYTGILTTFGRVENETMEAGFHLKAPWQSIVKMNNQEQRKSFTLEAFSSDIQQVNVSGSINYNIDKTTAMTLYREVGTAYSDTLIIPRLYENTKAVFSHYKAEELISNRDALSDEIRDKMIDDLNSYGVNVLSISIEVEAKQVASQNKLKAETEQEQQTMEARAAAERRQIEAEAQAEVERINADAEAYRIKTQSEAEAEANKKIAESLSEQLIEYNYANSWNGQLPSTFVGDGDAIPVIQTSGEQ